MVKDLILVPMVTNERDQGLCCAPKSYWHLMAPVQVTRTLQTELPIALSQPVTSTGDVSSDNPMVLQECMQNFVVSGLAEPMFSFCVCETLHLVTGC